MASFAKPPNATSAESLAGGHKPTHPDADSNGNETSIHPDVWIMLAEDALNAGRRDQAEELIGEAYLAYDEAMKDVANSASGSAEEEPEFDFQQVSEVNQMGGYNHLLSTLISSDSSGCAPTAPARSS